MKQIYIICIVFLTILHHAIAQDSIVDQDVKINSQIWLDYNFSKIFNENQNLSTLIGFRKITPEIYNRVLGISTLNIKNTKKLINLREKPLINSYHIGGGLIYTQNYNTSDNIEIRLIQGFRFEIPTIKLITLYNYVRLEERLQNSFANSGWTAGFRLRYQLSTILSWKKHYLSFAEGLYIPIQTEVFFNLKRAERFNDLIRISPGIGYRFKNDWRFELYGIFNRTKNITETNDKSSEFVLRLRVYKGNPKKQVLHINEEDGF
ncbi:DUF2490 domain-containing protein [Maribacter sp. 1_MG-2023]|uniref:DUF2490 domain-containing protein n=1 Tax=Maribacter sp. 1_MG-2023 TaxID=3062677 RepID=UPI0026E40881|nr:DUF2490 domain-containing protein [Maribacter sp. 1_MG-2023]MDO6472631.1 DUF2490 domain-containing protein [Maribacter sp. 1_MG-2023]